MCTWEQIKMYFTETGLKGMKFTHMSQDRCQWLGHVNTVMSLRAP